jgi:hypothetical protein
VAGGAPSAAGGADAGLLRDRVQAAAGGGAAAARAQLALVDPWKGQVFCFGDGGRQYIRIVAMGTHNSLNPPHFADLAIHCALAGDALTGNPPCAGAAAVRGVAEHGWLHPAGGLRRARRVRLAGERAERVCVRE